MPRSSDSPADRELTARLGARDLLGSTARYERWRAAGLLPRHQRHRPGRGRGSSSTLDPATVEIAAALARHTVQGRDLRATVIDWFFEAGHPTASDEPPVPEPPAGAVIDALVWAVRTDPGYALLQRARAASTEQQQDEFYEHAVKRARRGPNSTLAMDPSALRHALLSGTDPLKSALGTESARTDMVHYIAALGMGAQETGPEAFAEALTAIGLFPTITTQQWQQAITEAQASGDDALAEFTRFDPAATLQNAGIDALRRAREVALGLAGFGSMLLMHALLMPDTPGLAALRVRIQASGTGPALLLLARQVMHPRGIAFALAGCLHPMYQDLYEALAAQMREGPPLMHRAGDEQHDPEAYMAEWLETIQTLGSTGPHAEQDEA